MNETNLFKNLINNLDDHITEMDTVKPITYTSVGSNYALDNFTGFRVGNFGIVRFRVHCTTATSSGTSTNLITLNLEANASTISGMYTHLRNNAFQSTFFTNMSGKSVRESGTNNVQVSDYFIGWILFHIG